MQSAALHVSGRVCGGTPAVNHTLQLASTCRHNPCWERSQLMPAKFPVMSLDHLRALLHSDTDLVDDWESASFEVARKAREALGASRGWWRYWRATAGAPLWMAGRCWGPRLAWWRAARCWLRRLPTGRARAMVTLLLLDPTGCCNPQHWPYVDAKSVRTRSGPRTAGFGGFAPCSNASGTVAGKASGHGADPHKQMRLEAAGCTRNANTPYDSAIQPQADHR